MHNGLRNTRASLRIIDPALRLVSRQFSHEIDTVVSQKNSKLEVECCPNPINIIPHARIAETVQEVKLDPRLAACACRSCLQTSSITISGIDQLQAWIEALTKNLPYVKQTHVCILMSSPEPGSWTSYCTVLQSSFKAFLQSKSLATLAIGWRTSENKTSLASWTHKEGWQDLSESHESEG